MSGDDIALNLYLFAVLSGFSLLLNLVVGAFRRGFSLRTLLIATTLVAVVLGLMVTALARP